MSKKRPDKAQPFKMPMLKEEDSDASQYAFFGLALGVFGILFRQKQLAWAGLVCNILSIVNKRAGETDYRSGLSSLSFSFLGLTMLYAQFFTAPANASIFDPKTLVNPGK
jgi:hypothetical protein